MIVGFAWPTKVVTILPHTPAVDPPNLDWTPSRKKLEDLIAKENGLEPDVKTVAEGGGAPLEGVPAAAAASTSSQDALSSQQVSQEKRLRERLGRLGLEMAVVSGDGNCQVWAAVVVLV